MNILLACATRTEGKPLRGLLSQACPARLENGSRFWKVGAAQVRLLRTGISADLAAGAVRSNAPEPDAVIVFGIAGQLDPAFAVGSIVIPSVWYSDGAPGRLACSEALLLAAGKIASVWDGVPVHCPMAAGITLRQPALSRPQREAVRRQCPGAAICDMETFAVLERFPQAGRLGVRIISDDGGEFASDVAAAFPAEGKSEGGQRRKNGAFAAVPGIAEHCAALARFVHRLVQDLALFSLLLVAILPAACTSSPQSAGRIARSYARVPLQADIEALSPRERAVLERLRQAAGPASEIFWKQTAPDAPQVRATLEKSDRPEDRERLSYFLINYGPYDRLRNDRNFLGEGERSPGAGFYPDGLTSIEFEAFLVRQPLLKGKLQSPTTLIRRTANGFEPIPYEQAYAGELSRSASFLNQAALLSDSPPFARYLKERARALVEGDYLSSDRLWVSLRNEPLDIVIGPIETAEDQLLGIKAAYESAVLVRDPASNRDLEKSTAWASRFLPSAGFHRAGGPSDTMEVWQVALFAGRLDAGVKTVALTLPNDDRVRTGLGTRKLIFSNVLRTKFEKVLRPLSEKLFDPEDARDVTEDSMFQQVLLHESCHLFQAGDIRAPLADTLPVLDELKADLLSLYVAAKAADEGLLAARQWRRFRLGYLAGVVRAVRMGVGTPHAQANAVQLDALRQGKVLALEKGVFRIRLEKLDAALQPLLEKVRRIEERADYAAARELLQEKARVPTNIQRKLIALDTVPADVAFDYGK